jgi:hypothetical protein
LFGIAAVGALAFHLPVDGHAHNLDSGRMMRAPEVLEVHRRPCNALDGVVVLLHVVVQVFGLSSLDAGLSI